LLDTFAKRCLALVVSAVVIVGLSGCIAADQNKDLYVAPSSAQTRGAPVHGPGSDVPDNVVKTYGTGNELEYVRVVKESVSHDGQPVKVEEDKLAQALDSIQYRPADGGRVRSLLNEKEVQRLSRQLKRALAEVSSGEEVVFAMIGPHGASGVFAKGDLTTGRVFVDNGNLQVIIGEARKDFLPEYLQSGYLPAFTPGNPSHRVSTGWNLGVADGSPVRLRDRGDWAEIPLAALQHSARQEAPARATEPAQGGSQARPEPQRRTLRDRLKTLKQLHDDGLITDQDYDRKRKEILEQL